MEANSQIGFTYDSLNYVPEKEKSFVNKENNEAWKEMENNVIVILDETDTKSKYILVKKNKSAQIKIFMKIRI